MSESKFCEYGNGGVSRREFIMGLTAVFPSILATKIHENFEPEASSCQFNREGSELVVNGGFEDGDNGWKQDKDPTHLARKALVEPGHCGGYCLKLVGPGQGYYQDWEPMAIASGIRLEFYTRLERVEGEINPHALLHLYFLPHAEMPHWPRYHIDITVTPDDVGDPTPSTSDPAPGATDGGIFMTFNRKYLNDWVPISLDVTGLIEKQMPDYLGSRVSGVLLESSEGGVVYYDHVSVRSLNPHPIAEGLHLVWAFFNGTTLGRIIGLITIVTAGLRILGFFKRKFSHIAAQNPKTRTKPKSERSRGKR